MKQQLEEDLIRKFMQLEQRAKIHEAMAQEF